MFLTKKSPRNYVGLYQKFLYKSFIITDPPPQTFLSKLPWCNYGCVCSKEHSVLWSPRIYARFQWSVRISQIPCQCSDWTISVWHIKPKWHAPAFCTKLFSSLPRPFLGRPSIVTRVLRSSGSRGQMKAYLKNSLPLLHQRSRIWPPHNLPQRTILRIYGFMSRF